MTHIMIKIEQINIVQRMTFQNKSKVIWAFYLRNFKSNKRLIIYSQYKQNAPFYFAFLQQPKTWRQEAVEKVFKNL